MHVLLCMVGITDTLTVERIASPQNGENRFSGGNDHQRDPRDAIYDDCNT